MSSSVASVKTTYAGTACSAASVRRSSRRRSNSSSSTSSSPASNARRTVFDRFFGRSARVFQRASVTGSSPRSTPDAASVSFSAEYAAMSCRR